MVSLFDFLTEQRAAIVAAWAAEKAAAGPPGDAARLHAQAAGAYEGLVLSLRDLTGDVYRTYVDQVVKPRLRAGATVADLHASAEPLVILIHAAIEQHVADPAERAVLHEQLNARMRRAYGLWDLIAAQIALEQVPKREA
jgi:hypothetical protein